MNLERILAYILILFIATAAAAAPFGFMAGFLGNRGESVPGWMTLGQAVAGLLVMILVFARLAFVQRDRVLAHASAVGLGTWLISFPLNILVLKQPPKLWAQSGIVICMSLLFGVIIGCQLRRPRNLQQASEEEGLPAAKTEEHSPAMTAPPHVSSEHAATGMEPAAGLDKAGVFSSGLGDIRAHPIQSEDSVSILIPATHESFSAPKKPSRVVKPLSLAFLGLAVLSSVHVLLAERPFWFMVPRGKDIDPKVLASSVVGVVCESIVNDTARTGSGIMLLEDGAVLTNAHVIPHDDRYLHTPDAGCVVVLADPTSGSPSEMYWAKPIVTPGVSDEYDLAYLKVYSAYRDNGGQTFGNYPRTFPALYDSDGAYIRLCGVVTPVQLGEPVRIFGYPTATGAHSLTVTEGIVSANIEGGLIATSAKVDSGNSGGLAVDKRGCLVGVPSAVLTGTHENLGVIIPDQIIREFQARIAETEK